MLPCGFLLVLAMFLVPAAVVGLWLVSSRRSAAAEVRSALEQEGCRDSRLQRRWATSGPFGGLRRWGAYYKIEATDPTGQRRHGWARFRARWPGQSHNDCVIRWNQAGERWWAGAPTYVAIPILLAMMAMLFTVFFRIASL